MCNHLISEQYPVYLVGTPSGRIVGPYHAECAARITKQARQGFASQGFKDGEEYGEWPSRREETLPE